MWLANSDTNIMSLTQHRVRKTVCFINLLQSKESLSNEGRLPVFSILLHKNCLSDSFKLKRKAFLLQLGTFDLLNNLAEKHLVGAVETGLTTCYALVWKKNRLISFAMHLPSGWKVVKMMNTTRTRMGRCQAITDSVSTVFLFFFYPHLLLLHCCA